ncbi:MAG: type II toxin-antitoxin system VapC family toxin [Deltaproteobacteria bacterium]|nr:MAG: type II toxin-antitoxin system VapC family toxin [Deltaproteobacteria bacterium]
MTVAPTHLLDTSVYSQVLKPRPLPSVVRRWQQLGDDRLAISSICEAELLYGLALRGSERLYASYERALKDRLRMFAVDRAVAVAFAASKAAQREKGRMVADLDLLIAATAKAHGLVVATTNAKHFNLLEGLAVEDWSQ